MKKAFITAIAILAFFSGYIFSAQYIVILQSDIPKFIADRSYDGCMTKGWAMDNLMAKMMGFRGPANLVDASHELSCQCKIEIIRKHSYLEEFIALFVRQSFFTAMTYIQEIYYRLLYWDLLSQNKPIPVARELMTLSDTFDPTMMYFRKYSGIFGYAALKKCVTNAQGNN